MGDIIGALFNSNNVLSGIIAVAFLMVGLAMYVSAKRKTVDCLDLLTNKEGKLDVSQIGQVFGMLLAVWAPVFTTLQGKLDQTVFGIALTYLGGVKGFALYMRYKQSQQDKQDQQIIK